MSSVSLPLWLTSMDYQVYTKDNYVVLDFETTSKERGHWREPENSIVLASWHLVKNGKIKKFHNFGNEFNQEQLVDHCNEVDFIVAHNAQFELGWLSRCGFDIASKPVFCTQIAEWILSGNRKWRVSLNACCGRRGMDSKEDTVSHMIKNGVDCSEIPDHWLLRYCNKDVALCHALFKSQLKLLEKQRQLPLLFSRCAFTAPLADIATKGMYMSKERVLRLYEAKMKELSYLEQKFSSETGNINPKSNKQMTEYLFNVLKFEPPKDHYGKPMLTPKGDAYSTSSAAMDALKPKTIEQKRFLQVRKELVLCRDAISKYVQHFYNCFTQNEKQLLFAEFNQTRTQTHRLSSTGSSGFQVQFQNIRREYKSIFTSRTPGWLFAEHDQAQLEYRCAVDMAGDVAGLNDIMSQVDAHAYTASIIHAKKWEDAQKKQDYATIKAIRTDSKKDTFKPLYGGSSGTKNQRKYYKAFKEKHKEINKWQQDNIATVLSTGKLQIPSGLIFYWPDTRITHTGYVVNTAMICNYPVQSFATADIVPLGVTFMWHRLRANKLRSFIVNTVHDSVLGEVDPTEKEKYDKIAKHSMTKDAIRALKALYNYDFTTPLSCEGEFNEFWSGGDI